MRRDMFVNAFNPQGPRQACVELLRVPALDGNLHLAILWAGPRLRFNAQRIHVPVTIFEFFAELELMGFFGVHDDDRYVERVSLDEFKESEYACGMFWFRKSEK